MSKSKLKLTVYLQCGTCGAILHGEPGWEPHLRGEEDRSKLPKFCPRCSAAFERYCLNCKKRVGMYFEEWWPEERECHRSYSPAKFCPVCKAGLEVHKQEEQEGQQWQ